MSALEPQTRTRVFPDRAVSRPGLVRWRGNWVLGVVNRDARALQFFTSSSDDVSSATWEHESTLDVALAETDEGRIPVMSVNLIVDSGTDRLELHQHAKKRSGVAPKQILVCDDGRVWTATDTVHGDLARHAREFEFRGRRFVATAGGDILERTARGDKFVGNPFISLPKDNNSHNYVGSIRNPVGVEIDGDPFIVFSRIGDAPEHLVIAALKFSLGRFTLVAEMPLLVGAADWEGVDLPETPTTYWSRGNRENAVRDASIVVDSKLVTVAYSAGGDSAVGIATFDRAALLRVIRATRATRADSLPLISISGFPHSGTTLVASMLAQSPVVGAYRFETAQFLRGPDPAKSRLLVDARRFGNGVTHVLEKTPRHALVIDLIAKHLPGTRFVFVIRDPRDLAASLLKRYGEWEAVMERLRETDDARVRFEGRPDVAVVRYESLISTPEAVLRDVCAHVGIDYDPAMLEYHSDSRAWNSLAGATDSGATPQGRAHRDRRASQVATPLFDGRGRWHNELSAEHVTDIEDSFASMMTAYGYERST